MGIKTHLGKDLQEILRERRSLSVNVQGLLIPSSALQSRLNGFCHNLARYTGIKDYPLQFLGSAIGLSLGVRRLLVCTSHQVKDGVGSDVGVIVHDQSLLVSSSGFTKYSFSAGAQDDDSRDLCLLSFDDACNAHPVLSRKFFALREFDILSDEDSVLVFLAYGCPFQDQSYLTLRDDHIGTAVRSMTCEPYDEISDKSLGACKLTLPMDFNPNGLSGGPVFAVVLTREELQLKFAGVINRAGGGVIRFIKAKHVRALIDLEKRLSLDG